MGRKVIVQSRTERRPSLIHSIGTAFSNVKIHSNDLLDEYPTVESVIESAVGIGYLLAFTKEEYNDENLKFCLALSSFTRDSKLHSFNAHARTKSIYDMFCSPSSGSQISIDSKTQEDLDRAMANNLCTVDIFSACLKHVVTTLRRDIFPRFRRSPFLQELVNYEFEDNISQLDVPLPAGEGPGNVESFLISSKSFCLRNVLNSRAVYSRFLEFTIRRHSEENLLCLKSIMTFEDAMRENRIDLARKIAWGIYHKYIKPNASSSVVVSPSVRQTIANGLATLPLGLFAPAEKMCQRLVYADYIHFQSSGVFQQEVQKLGLKKKKGRPMMPHLQPERAVHIKKLLSRYRFLKRRSNLAQTNHHRYNVSAVYHA